jgi:ADP-ribose pyrophosphatase YjhB (NUDIX family)
MKRARDSFCSSCGTGFPDLRGYPRRCPACGAETWANPIPISIVLLPIHHRGTTGLLVVRRDIEPHRGHLALVGGFVEEHETWQAAGARDMREEAGVRVDPDSLETFWFASSRPYPSRVLLFSLAPPIASGDLAPFAPCGAASERGAIFGCAGLSELFAFPLHVEAVELYFEGRGSADYTPL